MLHIASASAADGATVASLSRNVRAFIAYADDAPAGYVLAIVNEQPANEFCPARRYVLVAQISVEPEWERQGVGHQSIRRWWTTRAASVAAGGDVS
jgi:GNAT superfamily N-acetyltransferase